jgi:hypothetical protein
VKIINNLKLREINIMTNNKDLKFNQVTCVEHWEDNEETFASLINSIKSGHSKDVVYEMKSWPKSDLEPLTYHGILHLAEIHNETIVYDDFNYLLTANHDIIVLYQRL